MQRCILEEYSYLCAELNKSIGKGNGDSAQRTDRRRCQVRFIQGEHPCDQYFLNEDDQYIWLPSSRIRNLQREPSVGRPYQYIRGQYFRYRGCFREDRQGCRAAFRVRGCDRSTESTIAS